MHWASSQASVSISAIGQHKIHSLLHFTASVLVLPYVALAGFFLLVGEAARAKGLIALLDVALFQASWIFRWGIYSIPLLWLVLVLAGFVTRFRRMGALIVCLLATGSLLILVVLQTSPMEPGQLLFLIPCLAVAAMRSRTERPKSGR